MMIPRRLLRRYSVAELQEAIRQRSQLAKVDALEAKRDELQRQLERVERKLARLTGGNDSTSTGTRGRKPGRRKGYKLSAATRAKMRQAALRRYAGKNKTEDAKPRRKWRMSAAGRQRIADAARRRWAAARAAKESPKAEATAK